MEIHQIQHEYLVRDGYTLHASISIPMTRAALGTTVTIETLDGPQEVLIKPGTQSGSTVVLKDLGVTRLRGGGRGDLLVHVEVTTPVKLNKEQEELLKKLASLRGDDKAGAELHSAHTESHGGFFGRVKDAFNR